MNQTALLQSIDWRDFALRLGVAAALVLVVWLARRLLTRTLLPRLRRLTQQSKFDGDDILLKAIKLPVNLLFLALAIHLGMAALSPEGVGSFVEHLARTLVIMAVFSLLYQTVGLATRSVTVVANFTGMTIDQQLLPFVRTALRIVIGALAIVAVLQEWQYDVAGLIAGFGLSGLAFALAAEDTVSNLFGFTTIVGDRPLAVGEFIVTPDVTGTVEKVGFRSTRIRQLDQAVVTIPNSKLANSVITNWSRLYKRWVNMTIGLTYNTTSEQLREFIERVKTMLAGHELVDPESVRVIFTGFGDSALEVLIRAYFTIADWTLFMEKQQEVMLDIMDIVNELGLGFAFPSQSVYIEQLPREDPLPLIPPPDQVEASPPSDD
ncbi:MAG: mechanosensitive ion channel family protein [Anaerolineae bacterium]|nr:mechanosensitive ion channel family protein [Anaerolineae bacterium]